METVKLLVFLSAVLCIGSAASVSQDELKQYVKSILKSDTKKEVGKDEEMADKALEEKQYPLELEERLTCTGTNGAFTGLEYAALGYNVLRGFPMTAGRDPGFKYPLFSLDYDPPKYSADCKYKLPNGFHFQHISACETSLTSEEVKSQYSYDRSLGLTANVAGSGWGASFSASTEYKSAVSGMENSNTMLVISKANCKSYFASLDTVHPPPLAPGFLTVLRELQTKTDNSDYQRFLDDYGTHFIKDMTFGARFGRRHEVTQTAYSQLSSSSFSISMQASYEGLYSVSGGAGMTSAQKDSVNNFRQSVRTTSYSVGAQPSASGDVLDWASSVSLASPMPLQYTLESMENLFTSRYFSGSDIDYNAIRAKILEVKPNFCNTLKINGDVMTCEPATEEVITAATWPAGSYGIPRTSDGCPDAGTGFHWIVGDRYHDTEDDNNGNSWSDGHHFPHVGSNIQQGFCMKIAGGSGAWPAGEYCIYRYNDSCPQGFEQGYLYWDDEDDDNANSQSGYLPDGGYDSNTRIEYCCRNDGNPYTEIRLPTTKPFYLFRKRQSCQRVVNTIVTEEYLRFDDEDDDNANSRSGNHPYDDGGSENHRLWYCYYVAN